MNRRTFIAAGAAAMAFATKRVGAQLMDKLSGTIAVSELTGAEIDLGRTGFSFYGRLLDTLNDTENLGFSSETCDAAVRFIPAGTDPAAYLENRIDPISAQMESSELVGMDAFDDGGWMAMTVQTTSGVSRGVYIELQLDAFPGYDLEVFFTADEEALEADFELMQQVLLEGLEPFLFTQESEMPTMIFSSAASSGSNRNGRGSGTRQSGTSTTGTNESRSTNTAGSEDLDADDVIQAVRDHQAQFMEELDRFYEIVDLVANENASSADEAILFAELMDLMFVWIGYPDTAGQLSFPSELSGLESSYVEWSDSIGQMGMTMSDWMLGEGEIDAFLDAIDVSVQLNSSLSAELRTLGVIIKPLGQGPERPRGFLRQSLGSYVSMHGVG